MPLPRYGELAVLVGVVGVALIDELLVFEQFVVELVECLRAVEAEDALYVVWRRSGDEVGENILPPAAGGEPREFLYYEVCVGAPSVQHVVNTFVLAVAGNVREVERYVVWLEQLVEAVQGGVESRQPRGELLVLAPLHLEAVGVEEQHYVLDGAPRAEPKYVRVYLVRLGAVVVYSAYTYGGQPEVGHCERLELSLDDEQRPCPLRRLVASQRLRRDERRHRRTGGLHVLRPALLGLPQPYARECPRLPVIGLIDLDDPVGSYVVDGYVAVVGLLEEPEVYRPPVDVGGVVPVRLLRHV